LCVLKYSISLKLHVGANPCRNRRVTCFRYPGHVVRFESPALVSVGMINLYSSLSVYKLHVHGSVHPNMKLIERTNKMQPCSRIYYSSISYLLNMFRATHRPSSGAQKLYLQPLVLHTFLVAGWCDG
jgi:hypothetical protein